MRAGRDSAPALGFACGCGHLRGHLAPEAVRGGTRLICHCPDCRAAELYLGQPDPTPDGVDLFQTTPDMITIDSGAAHLALLRLGPNGLLRWYAACCGTPLANTPKSSRIPFVGLRSPRFADPVSLGPVRVRAFVPGRGGKPAYQGGGRMALAILTRGLAARLSGRWRRTPFFDPATGQPVAPARIPDKTERAALY